MKKKRNKNKGFTSTRRLSGDTRIYDLADARLVGEILYIDGITGEKKKGDLYLFYGDVVVTPYIVIIPRDACTILH